MASLKRSDATSISAVARQFGMRPSAIRYYESIGLLPRIARRQGQRTYDDRALRRLSIIAVARSAGLSLEDIRMLFFGFDARTSTSQRWRELSDRKHAQLEDMKQQIARTQELLRRLGNCRCESLEKCGEKLRERASGGRVNEAPVRWSGSSRHTRTDR
jgi:MerR family transcriptional regulator, redox-sensitive transcriptional activator SoxR